jgi:ATP-dependent DNA helicase 2 subunit 1
LQLKDLTVVELKYYLSGHNLPVSGKKEALVSRILTHMGKWLRGPAFWSLIWQPR